ncbi:DUF429 domain-containing protein [Paludibacterium sp. B53371]|uniref:DUF429 domain-containing protein n=1 Tax=Paludibacterium sp. B53371 TaxID=2806263 RepID=UPI001C04EFD9|nr:DUF429 domain-containing protein [Paludibacterium sp. B53371]
MFLGFDPGGAGKFGWACLSVSESGSLVDIKTGVSSSAQSALKGAVGGSEMVPVGVGIDAPLYWVTEGDRRADAQIRQRVCATGGQSGTVAHVNSLRGACLVQGVMVAKQIAMQWPRTLITEAHPKALLQLYPAAKLFLDRHFNAPASEHERDAVLAAFAAWCAANAQSGWRNLLSEETSQVFVPGGHDVGYWFPC